MNYLSLHGGDDLHIEQSAKEFCRDFIRKDYDKFEKAKQFPREVFREMGKLGFLGAMIPEEYGGAGMSMGEYVVLMESLACYGGGAIALTLIAHHSLAAAHITYTGTERQKEYYLPKMARGELIGAWCLTEPGAGSDAFGGMQTTATWTEMGWRISGSKLFITNGFTADVYVVISLLEPENAGTKDYGVFIVPRLQAGLSCRPETNKAGMHASDTAMIFFDNVSVENGAKMTGDGKQSTLQVLNNGRVGISALACGLMRSALSEAVNYAKERKSFGKPISKYQGVSFPLAEAKAELTACWAMVEKSARACDEGNLTPELASDTKLKVTESVFSGCFKASCTFGGLGYIRDNRATQDFLDAFLLVIGEGTSNIQRLTIAKGLFAR